MRFLVALKMSFKLELAMWSTTFADALGFG